MEINLFLIFFFFSVVKPLAFMGITVRNDVQQTAKTMSVTYRTEHVLGASQDGVAQLVTQV